MSVELRTEGLLSKIGGCCRGVLLGAALPCCMPGLTAATDPGVEFFEARIRPILVDHCYPCHSSESDKVRGGLLLDTRAGLLKGGDSGPAVSPGDPDHSLLVTAVRYTDENLQMPPKNKKLGPEQIAVLEQWVTMGAPDPRVSGGHPQPGPKQNQGKEHWAFRPIERPPIPEVKHLAWVQQPTDAFVLASLEAKGLTPSPRADRRTLIRRVTFDLTGLPPTREEVDCFLADDAPDAFSRVVERLLASPRYGERWGRYWLDVARYADTKGYVFEEERRYPYAYTYRDYVIRSLNEDLPFDRFVVEQIAADQLPLGDDKRPLAALGYLTLGRRFLNNPHDIIDDRIDVVTRGMMGLTVSCARCHDHKYDPITSQDYYSLYGVFASCSEPEEKPLLGDKTLPSKYSEYQAAREERLKALNTFKGDKEAEIRHQLRDMAGDYMLAGYETQLLDDKSKAEALARERKLDPGTVQRWAAKLEQWGKERPHPVFAPWFALAECSDDEIRLHGQDTVGALALEYPAFNEHVLHALSQLALLSLRDVAERYGSLFSEVERLSQDLESATGFPDAGLEQLRQVLYGPDSPTAVPEAEITKLFDVPSIQKLRALKRQLEELDATHPGAPPRAMVLTDSPEPKTPHVFIRGNPANPGPSVERRFIAVLAGGNARPFKKGSGRLELAEAIANQENPLTARVLVNRVWLHYFGAGLVRTPSDFGFRSEPPSHPELLDYLAARFMEEGWSLKKLHRWIVLASVYQQASEDNPASLAADPANLMLWKMNRRRLDFEATRDSLLAISGQLDRTVGGQAVDILAEPFSNRRTIYGFIERQNLPGLFRTFDFANPDTTSPQRFSTTVPQQALFMLNSPFVELRARQAVRRDEVQACRQPDRRVRSLYRVVLQREPSAREVELALNFIDSHVRETPCVPGRDPTDPGHAIEPFAAWDRLAQVLLMSNEFVFVD